jgi:hypothetical protein
VIEADDVDAPRPRGSPGGEMILGIDQKPALGLVGDIAGPEHLGDVSPAPQQQAATLAGRRFSRVPDH